MLEILGKTNIDFMGKRKIAFAFSSVMVLLGLIAVVQIARGAANLGIDFSGGTAVQLKFEQPIKIDEARKILESSGLGNAELQEFGQDNKLLIRVKTSTTIEEKTAETVIDVFKTKFSSNGFVVDSSTEIGPTIGKKLQEDALIAIVISFIGIILYVAARFELRFGGVDRDGALDAGGIFADRHRHRVRPDQGKFEDTPARDRRGDDQYGGQPGIEPHHRDQLDGRARAHSPDAGGRGCAPRFFPGAAWRRHLWDVFIRFCRQPAVAAVAGKVRQALESRLDGW